jgi:hypothetical protein
LYKKLKEYSDKHLKETLWSAVCESVVPAGWELTNKAFPLGQVLQSADGRVEGKAIPLQAFKGPEGSWSLRLSDFKTIGT